MPKRPKRPRLGASAPAARLHVRGVPDRSRRSSRWRKTLREWRAAHMSCAEAMAIPRVMRACVVLALTLGAGCVLFVPEAHVGDHCAFDGADTDCGACMRAFCTDPIDAACGDPAALKDVIPPMEACAARGDASCDTVPASDVATCMRARCAAVCYARVGASATHCTDAFLAPSLACTCDTSGPPNDLRCASAAYPRATCCAPVGWPAPGLECACAAILCAPLTDGCNCVLTDNLDAANASECHGLHCCASEDHCQ